MLTTTTQAARATLILLAAVVAAVLLGSCSSGSSGGGTTVTPLSITTQSLPDAQVNHAYTGTLAATGGTAPYTWALTAGVLPPGLSLDTSSGVISGTPIGGANGATLTFRVSDSASPAATSTTTLTLTVLAQGLSVTTRSLPDAHLGVAYDATLTATGGVAPYTLDAHQRRLARRPAAECRQRRDHRNCPRRRARAPRSPSRSPTRRAPPPP